MITPKENKSLLEREPRFEDSFISLQAIPKIPKLQLRETRALISHARRFNDEVARPMALKTELKTFQDPDYIPWELVNKANEWGFYTMFIPKLFGGQGYAMPANCYVIEELSSACVGLANVAFVHYLGFMTVLASWNIPLINRVCRDVAEGERTGNPCLISLAITEPGAGTDTEETQLLDRGKITCYAEKVKGGYVVNGSKIFISNGHVSTWCALVAYTDLKKPSANTVTFAVKTGTKGFTFGKHEDKMGQRACVASELIFEDCFIPDDCVMTDSRYLPNSQIREAADLVRQYIHYVVEVTRASVGAFGTGVARGAYEQALKFAAETEVEGKLLINHEWAQIMLAEMYKNVVTGRLTYTEANYAHSLPGGVFHFLQLKPVYYYLKFIPQFVIDMFFVPFYKMKIVDRLIRKIFVDGQSMDAQERSSGYASIAKFVGTDMGVKNSQMALEMMGQAGLKHEVGAEKILRDSKLLQIYEGTNQLNRLNLFDCLIARCVPQAKVFEE
ncbi:MAG TPA: acyl-CoA dehydrogenase family protein [Alphaproteobacteria bacterium]|jgi:alkylation response protein AidB-like acyl-CoA dehydrogenase|nr:acyl-CoA dehydrogenase family protein [Alphaproteobacteria bacterium]